MKLFKLLVTAIFAVMVTTTVASAGSAKGQKLYLKKMKQACGMNGGQFAAKKTEDGWADLDSDEAFLNAIKEICPNLNTSKIKSKYIPHLRDFGMNFASDSGNVPSC